MDREGTPATGSTDARLVSEVLDKHWIDINSTLHFIANLLNGHPTEVLNPFLWSAHMTRLRISQKFPAAAFLKENFSQMYVN